MVRSSRIATLATLIAVFALLPAAPIATATTPDNNGRILFEADTSKGRQIFTIRPDGHDLVQVTHVEGGAVLAEWSPDGRQIAFTHAECSIALIDGDGANLRVIASDPELCLNDPSFMPDGSRLVYTRFDPAVGAEQIWSMDLDGGDQRFVTAGGGPDPNVSPDGTKLSYKEPGGALMVADVDGSGAIQVSPSVSVTYKHDWAPDGRHLVVSDDSDPSPEEGVNILILTPDGSETTYLTDFPAPMRANVGSYSPDGKWILFRLEGDGPPAMYRIRPDGSGLHKVFESATVIPRFIDWGPKVPTGSAASCR
jgi:Tol biopolymer transport system component